MLKRLPAYMKLAWALIREPAIPWKHKLLLYSVVVYEISPPHMVIAAIPVLGQIDSVLLFLLGLQQALAHCPPTVADRHLAALRLSCAQMDADRAAIKVIFAGMFGKSGHDIGDKLRFAGRVAQGFAYRRLRRWLEETPRYSDLRFES